MSGEHPTPEPVTNLADGAKGQNRSEEVPVVDMNEFRRIEVDDPAELIDFFQDALQEKNSARAQAILEKLARKGDENEILNWYGYPSTVKGMHDFFNTVMIGQLGMQEQEAYALEYRLATIAEARGHWELARTITTDGGRLKQRSEEEHAADIAKAMAEVHDEKKAA